LPIIPIFFTNNIFYFIY